MSDCILEDRALFPAGQGLHYLTQCPYETLVRQADGSTFPGGLTLNTRLHLVPRSQTRRFTSPVFQAVTFYQLCYSPEFGVREYYSLNLQSSILLKLLLL
jgi:hypothetical protein